MLRPWWRHDGCVPEVDDDQLAALRRLRAAFGPSRSSRALAMSQSLAMTPRMIG